MKIYLDNNVLVDIESGKYSDLLHIHVDSPKILTSLKIQAETCRIFQFPPEIKLSSFCHKRIRQTLLKTLV